MRRSFLTKGEATALIGLVITIFLAFLFLIPRVFKNCIWEWSPRWNATCVKEQWCPAVEEAVKFPSVE